MADSEDKRDHVFISYATEDVALADWLARKLAILGFAVWYDRMQLLGGEPWPKDIDLAIKNRTYRMLALLSRASVQKENPSRERTTAQALGRELAIPDFLITLNVDGLIATEIPWTLSEINYISFNESWAQGLAAVVKKLAAVSTPRILQNGARLVMDSCADSPAICRRAEQLYSNCLTVAKVPDVIRRFSTEVAFSSKDMPELKSRWACRRVSSTKFLAFEAPPEDVQAKYNIRSVGGDDWKHVRRIEGIESRDLVVSLIHASINCLFAARGLVSSSQQRLWYFPPELVDGNWLRFKQNDGSSRRVLAVGERVFRSRNNREKYRYHLSPSLSILRGSSDPFLLVLTVRVHLTDLKGSPMEKRKIPSRRKHLCRNWWNNHWLARQFGIVHFLAGDRDRITIGTSPESELIIEGLPLAFESFISVQDTLAVAFEPELISSDEQSDEEVYN